MMWFLVTLVFCVPVIFIVALAIGSRPDRAGFRRCLIGACGGGIGSIILLATKVPDIARASVRLESFLAGRGLPRSFFEWSFLYLISGTIFTGMALGAGLYWVTRMRPSK